MLAQRGADLAGSKTASRAVGPKPKGDVAQEADVAPAVLVGKPAKRRLSFKEKHTLASLPGEIATLQNSVRRLQKQLDDPGLYARDRLAFGQASEALAAAQSKLAASEERWLEL